MRRTFVTPSALVLVFLAARAFGQTPASFSPSPNTYGTSSETVVSIGAFAFQGYNSFVNTQANLDYRWVTLGCCLAAPVDMPNGALATQVELDACDFSATEELQMYFERCPIGNNGCALQVLETGVEATPGCTTFTLVLNPQIQVVNATEHYLLTISTGQSIDTRFGAIRVRYKLQVSPAPATATFSDVPVGSGLHRFVEALYAAGVTAGCGNGKYCPNDPITRGQMAVFLSVALGLHFPN